MQERLKIGEILVRTGLIQEAQLRSALGEQARWGGRIGVTLVNMGLLSEDDLVRALGSHFGIPVVRLDGKRIAPEVTSLLPPDFVEKHGCIPLFVHWEDGVEVLFLGMEDPGDLAVIDDVSFRTGLKTKPVLVGPLQIRSAIDEFYRGGSPNPDDSGYDFPVSVGSDAPVVPGAPGGPPPTGPAIPTAPQAPPASAVGSPSPASQPQPQPQPEGYEHTFEPELDDDDLPEIDGSAPELGIEADDLPVLHSGPAQREGASAAPTASPVAAVGPEDAVPVSAPEAAPVAPQAAPEVAPVAQSASLPVAGPGAVLPVDEPSSTPESVAAQPPAQAPTVPSLEAPAENASFGPGVSSIGTTQRPRQVGTRDILRAVTKILISRGIFTREELIEAVRSVSQEDADSSD